MYSLKAIWRWLTRQPKPVYPQNISSILTQSFVNKAFKQDAARLEKLQDVRSSIEKGEAVTVIHQGVVWKMPEGYNEES